MKLLLLISYGSINCVAGGIMISFILKPDETVKESRGDIATLISYNQAFSLSGRLRLCVEADSGGRGRRKLASLAKAVSTSH